MADTLVCPHCGNPNLWSDEPASIMYTVDLTRNPGGDVGVTYTGVGYDAQDEGTVYVGDIWCRQCGTQLTEDDLVTEAEYADADSQDDDGLDPDNLTGMNLGED